MSRNAQARKRIEIASKRIPMKKLLHGKEIREAAKALEDFRMNLNEQEFLYGAKITLQVKEYGETYAVASRLETDKEFEERLEKARVAAEARKERDRVRKLKEAERAQREAETRKERIAMHIKDLASTNGLSKEELIDILSS